MRRQRQAARRANRIAGRTQVNGFGPIPGADRAYWPPEIPVRRITEDGDRSDVISDVRRQRRGVEARDRCSGDGYQIYHHRSLGISTQHQPGVGTARGHGLNVSARIAGAGGCRRGPIFGGGVVDGVHPERPTPNLRAQRVDKCLSDPTNTRWLVGAAGERHLDVGAGSSGRWDNRCAQQRRPGCRHRGTQQPSELACAHVPMLAYRDRGVPPKSLTCRIAVADIDAE